MRVNGARQGKAATRVGILSEARRRPGMSLSGSRQLRGASEHPESARCQP
jgi:hypothetical protein